MSDVLSINTTMSATIHTRFKHFLECNLMHVDKETQLPVYKLYDAFSKLEWIGTGEKSMLKNPDVKDPLAKAFLRLVDQSESQPLRWFIVGRQVQLSDSMFQRCCNLYKNRFLNVTLKNKDFVDLRVIDYMDKMNMTQVSMRLPQPRPCISGHTARLMREIFLLKDTHNIQYKVRGDERQLQQILKIWFNQNYTLTCEDGKIGYARRQLLEEANDFLVRNFGDTRQIYCHSKPWRWLMKNVLKMDDSDQQGQYLRLPCWKKDANGQPILNKRKSVGTGGEFTLEKRHNQRLQNRRANKRERDCARKARENKKKRQKKNETI